MRGRCENDLRSVVRCVTRDAFRAMKMRRVERRADAREEAVIVTA